MKLTKKDIGRYVSFTGDTGYGEIKEYIEESDGRTALVIYFVECDDEYKARDTWHYRVNGKYIQDMKSSPWDVNEFITPETHPQYFI